MITKRDLGRYLLLYYLPEFMFPFDGSFKNRVRKKLGKKGGV